MNGSTMVLVALVNRALSAATPLLLGTLGEICAQRSGVMNLGIEGMMAVGAVGGFAVASVTHNPWLGLAAALILGMLLSALHAFVSITLGGNQVVSGLAITTFGLGLSGLIGKGFIGVPLPQGFASMSLPAFSSLPVIGEVLFARDPVFYGTVLLSGLLWLVLYKTRWGLMIRTVGENPLAAETQGITVARVRWSCVLFGGACAGAAGGYLSLVYIPSWIEGMTAGRGWIIVALTMFSLWNPARAVVCAFLFGFVEVLQFFLQSYGIPIPFLRMLPYVVTLVALALGGLGKNRGAAAGPAALGVPYERSAR